MDAINNPGVYVFKLAARKKNNNNNAETNERTNDQLFTVTPTKIIKSHIHNKQLHAEQNKTMQNEIFIPCKKVSQIKIFTKSCSGSYGARNLCYNSCTILCTNSHKKLHCIVSYKHIDPMHFESAPFCVFIISSLPFCSSPALSLSLIRFSFDCSLPSIDSFVTPYLTQPSK